MPFTAGVTARILLNYDAADLTLKAPPGGLIAGPTPVPSCVIDLAAGAAAGEYARLLRVGCGFAGGGIREASPKEDIWNFSPFVIFSVPGYLWRMLRGMQVNGS